MIPLVHCRRRAKATAWLTWVAEAADDHNTFRRRAGRAAARLGRQRVLWLPSLPAPHPPANVSEVQKRRWAHGWQQAVLAVLAAAGDAAVPVLESLAYGPESMIQPGSIRTLCRIASGSGAREAILTRFAREAHGLPYDVRLPALCAAAQAGRGCVALRSAISRELLELRTEGPGSLDEVEMVRCLAMCDPTAARQEVPFLEGVVRRGQSVLASGRDWAAPLRHRASCMTEDLLTVQQAFEAAWVLVALLGSDGREAGDLVRSLVQCGDDAVRQHFRSRQASYMDLAPEEMPQS